MKEVLNPVIKFFGLLYMCKENRKFYKNHLNDQEGGVFLHRDLRRMGKLNLQLTITILGLIVVLLVLSLQIVMLCR